MAFKLPTQNGLPIDHSLYQAVADVLKAKQVGQWGSDHHQEAKAYSGWNYLAIAALGRIAARAHGYVYVIATASAIEKRKAYRARYGSIWKSIVQDGSQDIVPDDHWVSNLVSQPNQSQSGAEFRWEYEQQMHLHGCCLIFNRPSADGSRTAARYIIPMALTEPVYAGQDNRAPNGGVKILPYAAGLGFMSHPYINSLTGNVVPIEHLSIVRFPHPMLRGDGQSPTDAAGWWTDSATMIDMSRWKQLKRGPRPHGIVSVEGDDVKEKDLDSIETRLNKKLGDEQYDQRVIAVRGNVDMSGDHSPKDMDYTGGFEQYRDAILAVHGTGKAAVGLTDNMTYGSLGAALLWTNANVQSDLDLLAGDYTMIARDGGADVAVEFEVAPINDPTLIEQQLATDITSGIRFGREVRALRGLPPFGDWRDNARVTSAGFVVDGPEPPKPSTQAMDMSMSPFGFGRSMAKSLVNQQSTTLAGSEYSPVVAVDLDGTLAAYDGTFDAGYIGPAITGRVEQVRQLKQAGCRIVIFTCREDDALTAAWLDTNGVPYDAINCNPDGTVGSGKVFADVYWDDRAVPADSGIEPLVALLPPGPVRDRLRPNIAIATGMEKCWVSLPMPPSVVDLVRDMQGQIDSAWLSASGLEEEPHVTLLWGIVGTPIKDVVEAVKRLDTMTLSFGQTSTFDHPEGFVLKIDIESPALLAANAKLKQALPVAETHPVYHPHMTIAFMSGEEVDQFVGVNKLTGLSTTVTQAIVKCGDERVVVPLRGAVQPVAEPAVESIAKSAASSIVIYRDEEPRRDDSRINELAGLMKSMIEQSERRTLAIVKRFSAAKRSKPKEVTANRFAKSLISRMGFPSNDGEYRDQVRMVAERVSSRFAKSPLQCLEEEIDCSVFLGWRRHVEQIKRVNDREVELVKSIRSVSEAGNRPININVEVPPQTPPEIKVDVHVPKQDAMPVPVVNVDVHVPEQSPPQIVVNPSIELSPELRVVAEVPTRDVTTKVFRDADGLIERIEQSEM